MAYLHFKLGRQGNYCEPTTTQRKDFNFNKVYHDGIFALSRFF